MLLGVYGLCEKPSVLKYMWPERDLNSTELISVQCSYREMTEVGCLVDHITCHADGTFHVKTRHEEDSYIQGMRRTEPLGPDTGIFLELFLISDLAQSYAISEVKYPHVWVNLPSDHYISFRGMFSGVNYELEKQMIATMKQFKGNFVGTRLVSRTLKGLLMGRSNSLVDGAKKSRPRGSILSFKFPVREDQWHIKIFLFQ